MRGLRVGAHIAHIFDIYIDSYFGISVIPNYTYGSTCRVLITWL